MTTRRHLLLTPILFPRPFLGLSDELYLIPTVTAEHIADGMAKVRVRFLFVQIGVEFHYTTIAQLEMAMRRVPAAKTKAESP